MLKRLFGEPEVSGLESDAYWLGLFLGLYVAFVVTFLLAFAVLPAEVATTAIPLLIVLALLFAFPLARGFVRLFSWAVDRYRAYERGPPGFEELE